MVLEASSLGLCHAVARREEVPPSSVAPRPRAAAPVEVEANAAAVDLATRIVAGDQAAEAELVERFSRPLLFFLRRRTGDPALADDLHQEAFRIVLLRLRASSLEEPAKLGNFLYRTARNLLVAHHRKIARRRTDDDEEAVGRAVDRAPGQLGQMLRRERVALVRRLIGELKFDRDRQLLYRYYIAEEGKEPICTDLGLSGRHFDRVLYRAKQRFKDLLLRREKRQKLPNSR